MVCCTTCEFRQCICQDFWSSFDETIDQAKRYFDTSTPFRVSTITVNFKLMCMYIDFNILKENFKSSLIAYYLTYMKNSRKSKTDDLINFQMYNSCTITGYINSSTIGDPNEYIQVSTKIFHNGSFNITGCRSVHDIKRYIHKLLQFLTQHKGVLVPCDLYCIKNPLKVIVQKSKNVSAEVLPTPTELQIENHNRSTGPDPPADLGVWTFENVNYASLEEDKKKTIHVYHQTPTTTFETIKSGRLQIHNCRIEMVNSDFTIKRRIHQMRLSNLLNQPEYKYENGGHIKECVFSLDKKYHAVKISYISETTTPTSKRKLYITRKRLEKHEGQVVIAVFNSGCVIITGGKRLQDIMSAYHFINGIFEQHPEVHYIDQKLLEKKPKKRKKYVYQNGQIITLP
jgi:hypothetical protein